MGHSCCQLKLFVQIDVCSGRIFLCGSTVLVCRIDRVNSSVDMGMLVLGCRSGGSLVRSQVYSLVAARSVHGIRARGRGSVHWWPFVVFVGGSDMVVFLV